MGLVLTLERLGIPLLAFIFISKRWKRKEWKFLFFSKSFYIYCGMMLFWILYGAALLFLSPYAPMHEGLKELLDLFIGLLSVYCIVECCYNLKLIHYFFKILRIFVIIFVIFALIEMISGIHFPSSDLV